MTTTAARTSRNRVVEHVLTVALMALAVLIVLNQANPLTTRLGRDSGMYAYVASRVVRGDTPYLSAWEHKPPGIFFVDALGLALAGGLLAGGAGALRAARLRPADALRTVE